MTDKKLTDKEIIETLERCSKCGGCFGCAMAYMHSANCIRILETECLDLINRQRAEIERLKECPKCVYEYDGEVMEYCVQSPCSNFKTIEQIKADAYKEFAERLCEGKVSNDKTVIEAKVLLKEMVGEGE